MKKTRYMVNAVLSEGVTNVHLSLCERDVYQAVLIRFYFNPIHTGNATESYLRMLRSLEAGYHTICAFLDCRQYAVVSKCHFDDISDYYRELIIDKVYQLKEDCLDPLIMKCGKCLEEPLEFLRLLVKRKAEDSYVQAVWNSIRRPSKSEAPEDHSSLESLNALRRLMFEQNVSIAAVDKILDMLAQHKIFGTKITDKERAYALYLLMFWEAPESVVDHFLDQIPGTYKFDQEKLEPLVQSAKYSNQFWIKLMGRLGKMKSDLRNELCEFRPELLEKLRRLKQQ